MIAIDFLDLILWTLAGFGAGGLAGSRLESRKNRRLNAAHAECVQCPHKTPPAALSVAMRAAAGHQEATGHRVMVVKA